MIEQDFYKDLESTLDIATNKVARAMDTMVFQGLVLDLIFLKFTLSEKEWFALQTDYTKDAFLDVKNNYKNVSSEHASILIGMVSSIPLTHGTLETTDIFDHVYEYFLQRTRDNLAQLYTPKSIVDLVVDMIEPFNGSVYDPSMGTGGFFISSERFKKEYSDDDVLIYGQEKNHTSWRLATMNMVIRNMN
ncbi:MAG: N-6 DNA methylase, partial [Thiotrichaceae bacterium]|nr:N-6 DNA methylase [Thiotrichaceae bacterium]